jgi:hypothetical protein
VTDSYVRFLNELRIVARNNYGDIHKPGQLAAGTAIPTVRMSFARQLCTARTTFPEFPLVLMLMSTSPEWPKPSTKRSKTSAKP